MTLTDGHSQACGSLGNKLCVLHRKEPENWPSPSEERLGGMKPQTLDPGLFTVRVCCVQTVSVPQFSPPEVGRIYFYTVERLQALKQKDVRVLHRLWTFKETGYF